MFEGYSESGIYSDTLLSSKGCDSIRVLYLTVEHPTIDIEVDICAGSEFDSYTESGVYLDTIQGIHGSCDTIRMLTLNVFPYLEQIMSHMICFGESLFDYHETGVFIDTFLTAKGCDSIRELHLTVTESISPTMYEIDICDIRHQLNSSGVFFDTLSAYMGCDSIIIFNITGGNIYIPNVFSPNGDGINDFFEVFVSSFEDIQLEYFALFDRFGNNIYETQHWPVRWDGKTKYGQPYNPAVFAYVFIYWCGGKRIIDSGDVTLVN